MLYEINFINLIQLYFQKAKMVLVFLNLLIASNALYGISNLYCSTCDQYQPEIDYNIGCVLNITPYKVPSTHYFISKLNIPQNERCGECLTKLNNYLTYNEPPKLLILEYPYTTIKKSHKIKIKVNDTTTLL